MKHFSIIKPTKGVYRHRSSAKRALDKAYQNGQGYTYTQDWDAIWSTHPSEPPLIIMPCNCIGETDGDPRDLDYWTLNGVSTKP